MEQLNTLSANLVTWSSFERFVVLLKQQALFTPPVTSGLELVSPHKAEDIIKNRI